MTHQRLLTVRSIWRAAAADVVCCRLFRKATPPGPAAPEVLVTTLCEKMCLGFWNGSPRWTVFINANINAQVQGYIISRDYQEGKCGEKGDLLFSTIDPRPFEAALAQAKATLAKDQANLAKAKRMKNARRICSTRK